MTGILQTIQRDSSISFPFLKIQFSPSSSFVLFGKTIYFYGVIIAAAFLLGIIYIGRKSIRMGLKEDDVYDVLLWLIPFSILGARFYYVFFRIDYYLEHPSEIIAVWEGGLAIYGGVIAGFVVILIVSRHKNIPALAVLDLFITACILGQAIGRWGNFFNREAFGSETDWFCRMGLTDSSGNTIFVHPTFLYESVWDFLGFLILNRLINKGRKYNGQCLYTYLLWYGFGRALIEGLRTDSLYIPGTALRISQILSALLAISGLILLILHRKDNQFLIENLDNIDNIQ